MNSQPYTVVSMTLHASWYLAAWQLWITWLFVVDGQRLVSITLLDSIINLYFYFFYSILLPLTDKYL